MIKKLAVVIFLLGAVVLASAYVFAEDTAMPTEESIPAEEGVGEGVVTGEITALDAAAGFITVKGADGVEKAFNVVDGETILWKGIEDITLANIKQGDKAEVGYYTNDAGKLIASWVDVIVPEQPAAMGNQVDPMSQATPAMSEE